MQCLDDSALEPNDTESTAFTTPVGGPSPMFQVRAAVCPATDLDVFAVDVVTPGPTLEVRLTGETSVLDLIILTAGGTPIGNGQAGQAAREVVATVPDLPAGRFFVRVGATFADNYQLLITLQ